MMRYIIKSIFNYHINNYNKKIYSVTGTQRKYKKWLKIPHY